MNDGNYYFRSYIKVLFGSFAGAGRVLNFYESSCVGPDTVVGVDVADAFIRLSSVLTLIAVNHIP